MVGAARNVPKRTAHCSRQSSEEAVPGYHLVITEVDEDLKTGKKVPIDQISEGNPTEIGNFQAWVHGFESFLWMTCISSSLLCSNDAFLA